MKTTNTLIKTKTLFALLLFITLLLNFAMAGSEDDKKDEKAGKDEKDGKPDDKKDVKDGKDGKDGKPDDSNPDKK
ncbi:hypothetical protein NEPAR06_0605 [Nematocida parisii]|uniref:Uncharacterized protein n=1 Tax=Nematocida parisii (strain ERTm3) TaxID=935791 RepID=I3EEY7_NEMP3|nr:uncharacterized protein NEPG_01964 [Nematocida parisii ERTm1]EIJ87784.1 hypothetical protein NEQG_01856 [Nematocida parisii ERTm3]KAI5127189.1 hypothetical protein NEPAR08_0786 [Nematocida parisii]EIJ93009.1 hypothetical protein NEPG_01964 [Nematocida parisii ERTm1]KAI5127250.1 hypothetical protein NEPAR03_0854 [Nematocida parisii]KAI5141358.1 hypothetical protein NEPAR04_0911 [Nematocida parisii]|eukprot:XP_013059792.1 hypothetical protein NEPG_01964 [Nematocida parisii ERTm1]